MHRSFVRLARSVPCLLGVALLSCSSPPPAGSESGLVTLGRFAAIYDAATASVEYRLVSGPPELASAIGLTSQALTIGNDSTGTLPCAIIDHTQSPNTSNYCLGLVDPDNCATEYNAATKTLSFYSKLTNKSDLPNDWVAPAGPGRYQYTSLTTYPRNTTYYGPFYFVLTGVVPRSGAPVDLVQSINTNLPGAQCGGNGLSLLDPADDANADGKFDCIYPGNGATQTSNPAKADYPGWDFTAAAPGGDLIPGESTGCAVFMQFNLKQNANFTLYFDVVAVKDDGTLPPTPVVTSPATGAYVNANPITLTGTGCTPTTGTVYVSGGAGSAVSTACTAGGSFSLSVTLNANASNTLSVYQRVGAKQSGSRTVVVTHDNLRPTVIASSPAAGQTSVDRNTNCVLTFSEPLDVATLTTTNLKLTRVSTGLDQAVTVTPSADRSQAVLTPTTKPLAADAQYRCRALSGLRDRAGNAIDPSPGTEFAATFTTAPNDVFFADVNPPAVVAMLPADNAHGVPPSALFKITFDEPIAAATIVGKVIDPACNTTGGSIPNVFVFELQSCAGAGAKAVSGTVTLNAAGDQATFTPKATPDAGETTLKANMCYGFVITNCVKDLAGNALPNRGERDIGAYAGETVTYNSYNVFFTSAPSGSVPTVVSVRPPLDATDVSGRVYPHLVFNEAINPSTIIGDYFYLTEFGQPAHLPLALEADPTLQVVSLRPSAALRNATPAVTHVMTATGAVQNFAGTPMVNPRTSQFTVASSSDSTLPSVLEVNVNGQVLTAGAARVAVADTCPTIDLRFSEPMNALSLNASNLRLVYVPTGLPKPLSLIIAEDDAYVRLVPDSSLTTGTGNQGYFDLVISASVTDRAGNALGTARTYALQANTETARPSVAATVPAAGGSLYQSGSLLVRFSEPMDKSTLTATNLSFTAGGCGTAPLVFAGADGRYAVANCINAMTTGAATFTIARNVRDYYNATSNQSCEVNAGNRMAAAVTRDFTVLSGDDTTAPTVTSVSPADLATGVSTGVAPAITFSEAIDPRTIMPSTVFLMDERGALVQSTLAFSDDARTITLTPRAALGAGRHFLVATTALRDLGGGVAYNGLGGESTASPRVDDPGVLATCFSTTATACP
ncbi:MAG: Ig-like domain-containing protein [Proteobacteria bacterium]|nr:Ig-like domain-containing protein [Pseudomonadota bacterium]